VLGTIARHGAGFVAEVRRRPDVTILDVTTENRDELPARVARMLDV
jgi:nucleoside-triphosphatase THEP1